MSSLLSRLSFPLALAIAPALACGSETPSDDGAATGGSSASGTSGASTGGSSTGGSATGGSTNGGSSNGGSSNGGSGGASAGSAGQDMGGASSGGTDSAGAGPAGSSPGGSATGGAPGGMGGANGSGAGAPAGGAGSGDSYVSGVTVAVHSEIRTMLNVTWTQATAADTVHLEFTFPQGRVMTSRPKPGGTGMKRDVVIGVPGSTNVTVRVVSRVGGVDYKTRDYMGMTGAIPAGMPVPQVSMYNAALASPEQFMLGAVENSDGGCNSTNCYYNEVFWLYIIDRQGRIVWYYSDPASGATSSFQRAARDGGYLWIEKRPFSSGGQSSRSVLKRTLDGTYSESISVPVGDCIDVTTDGSLLYDTNNQLMERTRSGTSRMIWNCRAHFTSGSCYTNTINWNERDNTVVMSYPDRSTVIEVHRQTGMIVGQYGEDPDSYAFAPTPAPPDGGSWDFGYQHFANITKDGTLILSTHMPGHQLSMATRNPVAGEHSYQEYDIDRTNRRLTMRWFFQIPGQEWAMFKGMAMKLPNNNVIGNVGTGGVIREITPDKQTVFMVKFDAPATTAQNNDFFNKMVGHNFFVADLYSLNVGGPQ
ncbi:MAG TPA: hypothetical protein VFZ53_30240 [Polyangiaceae bacterium]